MENPLNLKEDVFITIMVRWVQKLMTGLKNEEWNCLKPSGFNAIRCSHNPPSPAFLDACDRLGMLVIDEAFDMWNEQKNPNDYHLFFNDWWKKDVESMVLRDRNHPSVIMWSIGNEIPNRHKPEVVKVAKYLEILSGTT